MGIFDTFEEKYANREFSTGTMVEPSKARIDHGRLATLIRRKKFSEVELLLVGAADSLTLTITNDALLSPRRIVRHLEGLSPIAANNPDRGRIAADIADTAYALLKAWQDRGYPPLPGIASVPGTAWTARLVYRTEN